MPHCFEVELAEKYGILEAILLNYFRFWIQKNEANNVHFHDGRYWTYNSVKAFCDLFPYASVKMIRNALDHLEEVGLIMTGNFNQSPFDQTKWYALTDDGMSELSYRANQNCPTGQMTVAPEGKPIPFSNTINNSSSFTPPTREEVRAYIQEKGFIVDPDFFFDYYESDDWFAYNTRSKEKEKMKNWKQKIIQWNKKELKKNPQKAEQQSKPKEKTQEEIEDLDAFLAELRKREREELHEELNKY